MAVVMGIVTETETVPRRRSVTRLPMGAAARGKVR